MHFTIYVSLVSWLLLAPLVLAAGSQGRRVMFPTEDGVAIVADYYPGLAKTKSPVAILLHMYKQDRKTWAPLVEPLRQGGFAVLAIDLRGHGESIEPGFLNLKKAVDDRDGKLFRVMWKDVGAAYNWLARQDEVDLSRFALVGASVGCSVAIDYAGRDKSVDVVACLTPGRDYLGVNSARQIGKYGDRPMLLLASEAEREDAVYLAGLVPSVEAKIIPQGSAGPRDLHGTGMFDRIPRIENQIVDYLKKNVGPETKENAHVFVSIKGKVYHAPTSPWVTRIKPENRRVFSSAREAAARGYRPPKKRGKGK